MEAGDLVYVPRPLLTAAPTPLSPVLLTWPANGPAQGSYRGVLKLYVDETGRVQRVEPEDDGLPASLAEAARQVFLASRFAPGQIEGHIVRSWIRIEVSFDTEMLPLGPPATP